jgi:2-aminobenzoate-CoA ligase
MDGMGWPQARRPSAHLDTFARGQPAAARSLAGLRFDLPELRYPARLNAATALLDAQLAAGRGDRPAVVSEPKR